MQVNLQFNYKYQLKTKLTSYQMFLKIKTINLKEKHKKLLQKYKYKIK